MSARLHLKDRLSREEMEARYHAACSVLEHTHWLVIRLLAQGRTSEEVAATVGYSVAWVRVLARRYNEDGPEALADGRRDNHGGPALLDDDGLEALLEALKGPPPSGGVWSGPQAARWMEQRLGRAPQSLDDARGWEALRKVGWRPQRPRPQHKEADPEAQTRFQAGPAGQAR